jgi:hypothetical protein
MLAKDCHAACNTKPQSNKPAAHMHDGSTLLASLLQSPLPPDIAAAVAARPQTLLLA